MRNQGARSRNLPVEKQEDTKSSSLTKRTRGKANDGDPNSTPPQRARSPSHSAKNKTPADRIWEFGFVLGQRSDRLICRACNLPLDHTRRSTIVEHLRFCKSY